jgi:Domain of unknown function (DUF4279)
METSDTQYAYFHVRGSFDPDEVTRRVGLVPTETAREGDVIGSTTKKRPCSLWALHSRLERRAPLEQHVQDVLDQLDANKMAFEALSRELGGTMELVGYFHECEPGVALERQIVERLAGYALTLDCDFYCR